MPQFSSELWSGPEPQWTRPWSGPKFGIVAEPDPKSSSGFGCYVLDFVRLSFSLSSHDPSTLPNHFPSPDSYLGHQCASTAIVLPSDSPWLILTLTYYCPPIPVGLTPFDSYWVTMTPTFYSGITSDSSWLLRSIVLPIKPLSHGSCPNVYKLAYIQSWALSLTWFNTTIL